jgi:hypothetical protein
MDLFENNSLAGLMLQGGVVLVAALVAIVSFAFLIPLDSVPAVTGVSIILSIAYVISFIAWLIVLKFYSGKTESLQWLNTHLIFLVLLPATIGATAMNVTAVQNTRNLLAGKVTA